MPPTKQRSSSFGAVSKSAIEQASSALQKLPEKPKDSWSLREAVSLLHDSIATALSRGYSHEEVASLLAGKGVSITPSSLKRYLAVVKREKEGATKTRRPRQSRQTSTEAGDAAPAPASTNGAAIAEARSEAAETPAASKRRTKTTTTSRRTKSTKADDQSDATKTAAKTKSKPTSRAKTPARSLSTRTRRNSSS